MNNNSLSVLMRMVMLGGGVILIALWKSNFIAQVYFSDQITNTGFVFNTTILLLFLLGLGKLVKLLLSYMFEERQLARFIKAMEADDDDLNARCRINLLFPRKAVLPITKPGVL